MDILSRTTNLEAYAVIQGNAHKADGLEEQIGLLRRLLTEKEDELAAHGRMLELMSLAASESANSMIIFGPDLRVEWVNHAFEQVTGLRKEDLVGTDGRKLSRNTGDELSILERVHQSKESHSFEVSLTPDNPKGAWIYITYTPVLDEHGAVTKIISVSSDITPMKKLERDLEAARAKAEESERLKQQFLANVSHEIRTPMNAIKGMTRLLLDAEPREDQLKYLKPISSSADHLASLVNDILDLSKIEAGKLQFESIDFNLPEQLDMLRHTMEPNASAKGLKLVLQTERNVPEWLCGDPTRLNQILINLVGNAIKFTAEGHVGVHVSKLNDQIVFQVADTGIGIPQEKLDTVFASFSQAEDSTTRKFGGTGLGLTIAKQLSELQGGSIHLDSTVGKGSVFTVSLPLRAGVPQDQGVTSEQVSTAGEWSILLAEDNDFNQMVAIDTLESWSDKLSIDVAHNGKIALEMLQKKDYDLILMDVHMPEMDGLEASRRIRQLSGPKKDTPILAMTAALMKDEIDEILQSGMNAYIPKPFEPDELFRKVVTLAGG